jgi:hypothetical protein
LSSPNKVLEPAKKLGRFFSKNNFSSVMKQLSFLYNITKPNLTLPEVVEPAKKLGRFDFQKLFLFCYKTIKLFLTSAIFI